MTMVGGTLGLTSAFGVNDSTITRKRVEADLAVFCDCRDKYFGMREACKEQLNWGVERYAKLPHKPELLPVRPVPSVLSILGFDAFGAEMSDPNKTSVISSRRGCIAGIFLRVVVALLLSSLIAPPFGPMGSGFFHLLFHLVSLLCLLAVYITFPFYLVAVIVGVVAHFAATSANGARPMENARRQRAYEAACVAALDAAAPVKAAKDHCLRDQIRDLDGLIKTVSEKAEGIRGILKTV
jgi:hypothetical protein